MTLRTRPPIAALHPQSYPQVLWITSGPTLSRLPTALIATARRQFAACHERGLGPYNSRPIFDLIVPQDRGHERRHPPDYKAIQ